MKSKVKGGGAVGFNMTPMIDIVFNLIIFFMLVSTFTKMQVEMVELPPAVKADNKKEELGEYTPVVINVVYVSPTENKVIVDGKLLIHDLQGPNYRPPDPQPLIDALTALKQQADERQPPRPLLVIYRADARVHYDLTGRVMGSVTMANIPNWWVQAYLPDEKEPGDLIKMRELGVVPGEVSR